MRKTCSAVQSNGEHGGTTRLLTILVIVGLTAMGAPGSGIAEGVGSPATYQIAEVHTLTGEPTGSGGTLVRTRGEVWARFALSGLEPDAAYSVWWVIWNDPALCVDGCGEDDLGLPGTAIFYAAGFVTGSDGTANLSVHLEDGPIPIGAESFTPTNGLRRDNGFGAEIHAIFRTHGPIRVGETAVQIGTIEAVCDPAVCIDQYGIAFLPTSPAGP